jgi:phospholipid-binding lipoprotein MlaA
MKLPRIAIAVVLAALVSACASAPPASSQVPPVEAIVVGAAQADAAQDTTDAFLPPATQAEAVATDDAPVAGVVDSVGAAPATTDAEDDYSAIYGDEYNPVADPTLPPGVELPVSYDPWEKYNRKMHALNNAVDEAVAKPLAQGYVKVVPRPVRLGVSNFFSNLGQPVSALNALLQGKPKQAGQAMGRFLMNSTLGIGGIFDPASDAKLPRKSEDFGQTLGVWGWKSSRYVELPLFGPRTVRDVVGLVGDAPLAPLQQVDYDALRILLQGTQLVDVRADLLAVDSLREGAVDEYSLFRDSWLQRRNYQISEGGKRSKDDENLPDYLLEEENNPTVPIDAMPMVIPPPGG